MKVYCNECKWLNLKHTVDSITKERSMEAQCKAPANKKIEDTALGRNVVLVKTPKELNENNDCKMYASKKPKSPKEEGSGISVGLKTMLEFDRRITALENKAKKPPGRPPKKEE